MKAARELRRRIRENFAMAREHQRKGLDELEEAATRIEGSSTRAAEHSERLESGRDEKTPPPIEVGEIHRRLAAHARYKKP